MITKRNMIDLIQNRLSGGVTPRDVRKMYPRGVIAKIVNLAYNDVVINNSTAAADMAIEYLFTPASDNKGFYVTLNPQPIAGTLAIFSVYDDKNSYSIQDKITAEAIRTLRGNNKLGAILFGNKLRFNQTLTGDVTVMMVPNVYQMNDDDILYAGGNDEQGEMQLFTLCLQVLSNPVYQDELNNNAVDVQQRGS